MDSDKNFYFSYIRHYPLEIFINSTKIKAKTPLDGFKIAIRLCQNMVSKRENEKCGNKSNWQFYRKDKDAEELLTIYKGLLNETAGNHQKF